ncbi:MAG: DUF2892 domain-containing protein [Pseudobdellovibrionaceae bacterium]|jgi:hypothetical protein|nr:DUF2892 domain-containing protein [Pseudobdellovibrionaceae bacterium]
MKQNVGKIDRIVRVVAGLALLSLFFVLEGDAHYLGLIGLIPLATAAMGFCPLYCPLKLSTVCEGEKKGACCGGGACDAPKE